MRGLLEGWNEHVACGPPSHGDYSAVIETALQRRLRVRTVRIIARCP